MRDCIGFWTNDDIDAFAEFPQLSILFGQNIESCFVNLYSIYYTTQSAILDSLPYFEWDSDSSQYNIDPVAVKILDVVSQRYCDNYIAWANETEDSEKAIKNAFDRVLLVLKNTWERYSLLCSLYEAKINNLLDGIKVWGNSVSKVKDTPQSEIDPLSNSYNSAVTANESETYDERESMIARLDEIRTKYRDLLKDWADEFGSLFLDNANI